MALLLLSIQFTAAQFSLDGEFRPRTEYRHGYGALIADSTDAGFAVSTRLRLNAAYALESYKFYASLQDIMVWGENRQLKPEDSNNSLAIFEAWAAIDFGRGFSTKLGRQVLSYDDQRIFGGVDWSQQARNHDAAVLKYGKDTFMADLGLAFSQDFDNPAGFQSVGTTYNTTGFFTYKSMQYLYLKQSRENLSGSVLVLNNGFQNFESNGITGNGTSNLLTLGTHLDFSKESFGAALNAYFQTGERQNNVEVGSAYLFGLDLTYKATEKLVLGLGSELISGNKAGTSDKTEAFFPLYGTNHKFNGLMDYFYVGNHANSIGLLDVHVSTNFKFGEKSGLLVKALNFSGALELPSGKKSLGTELDLVFSQNYGGFMLQFGYSHLLASYGMYELKGINKAAASNTQNWAWAMLVLRPQFLNTTGKE